jgi:branched-subunit amino acid aminotransferase/4-amino-4-deoxychorismate lyase
LLPGILRADLIEQRTLLERPMTVREVLQSPRVLFLNSVRGMYRVQVVATPENNTNRSGVILKGLNH